MNKAYFMSLVKQNKKLNILLFIAFFLSYPFITILDFGNYPGGITQVMLFLCLGTATVVLPIYNFKMFQNKKATDTYFALPIKKTDLMNATIIYTIMQVVVMFVINFIVGVIINGVGLSIGELILYLLLVSITVAIITIINYFIIEKCNNVIDSFIILLGYHLILITIYQGIAQFIRNVIPYGNGFIRGLAYENLGQWLQVLNPYCLLANIFNHFDNLRCEMNYIPEISYGVLVFQIILAVGAYILLMKNFKKHKAENSESLTDNKWAYPFIINTFTVTIIMNLDFYRGFSYYFPLLVVVIVGNLLLTFISQRNIKITRKTIIFFVSTFVIVFSLSQLAYSTKLFNLAYSFEYHKVPVTVRTSCKTQSNEPGMGAYTFTDVRYDIEGNDEDYKALNEFQRTFVDNLYEDSKAFGWSDEDCNIDIIYEQVEFVDNVYGYELDIKELQILENILNDLGYEGLMENEYYSG